MFPSCFRQFRICLVVGLAFVGANSVPGADWENALGPMTPGSFPEPRPVRVQYQFGWNGLTAATADLHLNKTAEGRFQLEGSARTVGLARKLWNFEGKHFSVTEADTLRPLQVRETEMIRAKRSETVLTHTAEGVVSRREEEKDSRVKSKTREFKFPGVHSLSSAFLYVRSRPLLEGATEQFVVYPSTSAYLCVVRVLGRERLTVPSGEYDAIKLDVQLNKVGKKRELLPHKKFKKATVWVSDDSNRLVLRVEAQIFIGTVFAELQSAHFENAKP